MYLGWWKPNKTHTVCTGACDVCGTAAERVQRMLDNALSAGGAIGATPVAAVGDFGQ